MATHSSNSIESKSSQQLLSNHNINAKKVILPEIMQFFDGDPTYQQLTKFDQKKFLKS